MNNVNQKPVFKVAEITVEVGEIPKLIGQAAQDLYVDDFNADGVPDELHLLREGNQIGFTMKLGEYVEVKEEERRANPLFANLDKRQVKRDIGFIWQARGGELDRLAITHCLIQDLDKNGLPDIRFAATRALDRTVEIYAFDLLGQAETAPVDQGIEDKTVPERNRPSTPIRMGGSFEWWSWLQQIGSYGR